MLLTRNPWEVLSKLQRTLIRRNMIKAKVLLTWTAKRRSRIINCVSIIVITYIILSWLSSGEGSGRHHAEIMHSTIKDVQDLKNDTSALTYTSPGYPGIEGKPFTTRKKSLRELNILATDYVTMSDKVAEDFVFATAASVAFFDMVKEAIVKTQKFRPNNTIYVYDLGLTKMQAHEIKSMCQVKYRMFGFSLYPSHVSRKFNYAWKPLIIADVLTRHPGVFWMDSSVRLTTGDFSAILKQVQDLGALALTSTGHSTFAATHPRMFEYLPAGDMAALKREQQWEATILMYKTRDIMTQVVKWMVLCALEKECIAPKHANRGCIWPTSDHYGTYGQCHRFDQSAFNILMMNYIRGATSWRYYARDRVCKVERYLSEAGTPKYCGQDHSEEDPALPSIERHEPKEDDSI